MNIKGETDFIRTVEGMVQYLQPECPDGCGKALMVICYDPDAHQLFFAELGGKETCSNALYTAVLSNGMAAGIFNDTTEKLQEFLKNYER